MESGISPGIARRESNPNERIPGAPARLEGATAIGHRMYDLSQCKVWHCDGDLEVPAIEGEDPPESSRSATRTGAASARSIG